MSAVWLPYVVGLCAVSVTAQQTYPLPRGTWRPLRVCVAQDVSQEARETWPYVPYLTVSLHFDPSGENPEPNAFLGSHEDVVRLHSRRRWVFDSTVDARLFARDQDLGNHSTWPVDPLGPMRLCFRPPDTAVETLELILSRHESVEEPFTSRLRVPAPGAQLRMGPLLFVFERIEPSTVPVSYRDEMPDFRRQLGNWRYTKYGPPVDRMSKLLFKLSAEADPDLTPYWFWSVTAMLGDQQVHARHAIMTYSKKPGVAWLGIWLPVGPEDLPDTFELEVVGEHLIVDEGVAEESVFELPMPALIR